MAIADRSMLTAGALLGAAAIAVATPAVIPGQLAGVATPLSLSQAHYELTALTDITVQGALEAFTSGWGGFIGPEDPYYPGLFNNDVSLDGFNGVAYYLADQALDGIVPFDLENYFFEVGSQSPADFVNAGLGAAAYVGASEIFGVGSLPAQLVQAVLGGGLAANIGQVIVELTAGLPVIGDLTSVYFTGQVAGDSTVYGIGVLGVLSYAVQTLLPGVPVNRAAALPAAAAVTVATAPVAVAAVETPAPTRAAATGGVGTAGPGTEIPATTPVVAAEDRSSTGQPAPTADGVDTAAAAPKRSAQRDGSEAAAEQAPTGEKATASTRSGARSGR